MIRPAGILPNPRRTPVGAPARHSARTPPIGYVGSSNLSSRKRINAEPRARRGSAFIWRARRDDSGCALALRAASAALRRCLAPPARRSARTPPIRYVGSSNLSSRKRINAEPRARRGSAFMWRARRDDSGCALALRAASAALRRCLAPRSGARLELHRSDMSGARTSPHESA